MGKTITIDPRRHDTILLYPRPANKKQLQRLIGLCNWHKKFINNHVTKMSPFYKLLKKGEKWMWGLDQERTFLEIKLILTSRCELQQPNFQKYFYIVVDASSNRKAHYIGQGNRKWQEILQYVSRTLKINWT